VRRFDLYCANPDCSSRAKGELFPVADDGIYLWEMQRPEHNDAVEWVLGDVIVDGDSWVCPDGREAV